MGNVAALFHSGSRHVGAGSGGLNIGYIQWTRFAAMTYQALPNTHAACWGWIGWFKYWLYSMDAFCRDDISGVAKYT